ncbi:MAG: DUF1704 domain-containing protein [Rubricoccaceae bacterium]|nr:DUF1704 domain-containing protein [Rubricoccaceae bacterium]
MAEAHPPAPPADWARIADEAVAALGRDAPVRCDLPGGGRLFLDRALPVLVVHRCADDAARRAICTEAHQLATSQPAYLLVGGGRAAHAGMQSLLRRLADALCARVGGLLLLELWTALDELEDDVDPFNRRPGFTLYTPAEGAPENAVEALCLALEGVEVGDLTAEVTRLVTPEPAPPGLPPLLGPDAPEEVRRLGLAVDAVFLNPVVDEFYPVLLRRIRDALAPALAEAAFAFTRHRTRLDPPSPDALGRRHLTEAAAAVDRGLAAAAASFDFLLQVTPVNAAAAWQAFKSLDGERAPELLYRPLTFAPDRLRRHLYGLPLDAVEDPLLAGLFRERRDEIVEQVRLILDRGTGHFLYGSLRLYGAPDDDLVALARALLDRHPRPDRRGEAFAGATVFSARAEDELAYYRERHPAFGAVVQVRDDITSGVMVSKGDLLVAQRLNTPERRVEALVAHEVGTHVVTYYNGAAQPLQLLRDGLADYEDLQEGLAVLAEYLVGGLSPSRLRTLAARVLAVQALADGASFVEVHRLLTRAHGFKPRSAFTVTVRVFRGGGLAKDMVYLRGLRDLLAFLGDGGALEPLYTGKIALRHAPAVATLQRRGLLHPPPLLPRHLHDPAVQDRLARIRGGLSVLDLSPHA